MPIDQHAKRKTNISENAGAMVPFKAPPPIDAVPLAAAVPSRAEPSWLRTRLLRGLGFRFDMEVRFIGEKAVTNTDLDTQQNRFRLPNNGVQCHIPGMVSRAELIAADLLHKEGPMPRPPKQPRVQGEQRMKKTAGKKHVGVPVDVVDAEGRTKQLMMKQWVSNRSTVIHGDGYLNFIVGQCGFKKDDVVEIWAFREKQFRLFGVDIHVESPLHILIAKE